MHITNKKLSIMTFTNSYIIASGLNSNVELRNTTLEVINRKDFSSFKEFRKYRKERENHFQSLDIETFISKKEYK